MGDFDAHLFTIDETSLALREYRPAERTASFSSEKGNVQHLPLSEAFLGRQAGSARSLSVRLRSGEPFHPRLQAPATKIPEEPFVQTAIDTAGSLAKLSDHVTKAR